MASAENRYRKIEVRMWRDRKFRELSPLLPSGQALWVYLLTGPHTGIIPGVFTARRSGLAEELAWTLEAFDAAFGEITSRQMAEADWKEGVVWIPNAIKCNPPQSPNVIIGWHKEWQFIPDCDLKTRVLAAMRSVVQEMGRSFVKEFNVSFAESSSKSSLKPLVKPSAKAVSNQEQEQEQLTGTETKENPLSEQSSDEETLVPRRGKQPSQEADRLAALLKSEILLNKPDYRITQANLRAWARTADLMIRVDKRSESQIAELIYWVQRDEFWMTNVLSMDKLRDKFDQLS